METKVESRSLLTKAINRQHNFRGLAFIILLVALAVTTVSLVADLTVGWGADLALVGLIASIICIVALTICWWLHRPLEQYYEQLYPPSGW